MHPGAQKMPYGAQVLPKWWQNGAQKPPQIHLGTNFYENMKNLFLVAIYYTLAMSGLSKITPVRAFFLPKKVGKKEHETNIQNSSKRALESKQYAFGDKKCRNWVRERSA